MTAQAAVVIDATASVAGPPRASPSRTARLASAVLLLSGAVTGASAAVTRQLPSGETLRALVTGMQIKVDARHLVPERKKDFANHAVCHCFLPLDAAKVPSIVKQALVAIEDRRFYQHRGFDARGVGRAVAVMATSHKLQGGSTITQQLAKAMVVGGTRRLPDALFRKGREIIVARRIERLLSKDEILTAFLNVVDFGSSDGWTAFGLEAAALKYYARPASELNLYEAAQLAGVLNGTQRLNPHLRPEAAHARTKIVLGQMVEEGFIKKADADRALKNGSRSGKSERIHLRAGFYLDWIFDELVTITRDRRLQGQVRFVVGLDPRAQVRAERIVRLGLATVSNASGVEGALVAMHPDGRVLALVGGRDFAQSQYNRATQAKRQPGSSFKPFVYAAAAEAGMKPDSTVMDAPLQPETGWPANFDAKYRGRVTLRHAFEESLNAAAVRVAMQVGLSKVIEMAQRLGVSGEFANNPSLALGSREVSLIELTAAYGAFANEGRRVHPYGTITATDARGYVFYRRQGSQGAPVVNPSVVASMRSLLRSAVSNGTGRKAALADRWVGGKTGTSQEFRDAWFVGLTDSTITGVWLGKDNHESMAGITGSGIPAILWRRFNENTTNPRPFMRVAAVRELEAETSTLQSPANQAAPPQVTAPGTAPTRETSLPRTPPPELETVPSRRRDERQVVSYASHEPTGTIVIKTGQRYLYVIQDRGRAIRYQVAVGRPGFTWSGVRTVTDKREWPDWHPPAEMRRRQPNLPKQVMGGPNNPLGARAIYLGSSLYRIHGSNEPNSIGLPVSSGCFRMRNEDVIDLYSRVLVGTKVIVE